VEVWAQGENANENGQSITNALSQIQDAKIDTMISAACDLSAGSIAIDGVDVMNCNGSTGHFSHGGHLTLFGPGSDSAAVSITNAKIGIQIAGITLKSNSPFVIARSTVTVGLSSEIRLTSTSVDV
jgi:hypothetical protein